MNSSIVFLSVIVALIIAECSSVRHFGEFSERSVSKRLSRGRVQHEGWIASHSRLKRAAQRRRPVASSKTNGARPTPVRLTPRPPIRPPAQPPAQTQPRAPVRSPARPPVRPPTPTKAPPKPPTRPPIRPPPPKPPIRPPIRLPTPTKTPPKPPTRPPIRRTTPTKAPPRPPTRPTIRSPTPTPIRPPVRLPTTRPPNRSATRPTIRMQDWSILSTTKRSLRSLYGVHPTVPRSSTRIAFGSMPTPAGKSSTRTPSQKIPTSVNLVSGLKHDINLNLLPEERAIGAGIRYDHVNGYGLSVDGKRTNDNIKTVGVNGHVDVFRSNDKKTNVEMTAGAVKTIGGNTQGVAELVVRQDLG